MSRWDYVNVLSSPELCGLTLIACEDIAGSWEFDMFAIWTNGRSLFWATDSGCSCPMPFEDYNSAEDLTRATYKELVTAINSWGSVHYDGKSVIDARMRLLDAVNEYRRNKGTK